MKQRTISVVITVVALSAIGAIAWWILRPAAPSPDAPPATVARFVSTGGFKGLSDAEQKPFLDRLRSMHLADRQHAIDEAGLTPEAREDVLQSLYRTAPQSPVDQLFALDPEARRRMLDRMIDSAGAKDPAHAGTTSIPFWDSSWRKNMLESMPPGDRARLAEFVHELNDRRRERGLPPDLPGR